MKIFVTLPVNETQRARIEAAASGAEFVFESEKLRQEMHCRAR